MAKEVKPTFLGSSGTNVLRGRDVRQRLMSENLSPNVKEILERIAEINHVNMKAIAELSTMFDQLVNLVQSFGDVAENMKNRTDQMARAMGEGAQKDDAETSH